MNLAKTSLEETQKYLNSSIEVLPEPFQSIAKEAEQALLAASVEVLSQKMETPEELMAKAMGLYSAMNQLNLNVIELVG